MVDSIKSRLALFAAMLAAAMLAVFMSASSAFASTYVTVNVPTLDGDYYPVPVDISTMASDNNYTANDNPFFAQFYKMTPDDTKPSYGWNVLVAPANQYVVVEDVLAAAVQQYNSIVPTSSQVHFTDVWASGSELALFTPDDGGNDVEYTKYYPSYNDVSSASYFYDTLTNVSSAFSSGYRTTPSFTFNGSTIANPQQAGAILALTYYQAMPTAASDMTNCVTLAATALGGTAKQDCPRMLIGGFDNGSVAGKRFCSNVSEMTIQ